MGQLTSAPQSGRYARPGLIASWLLLVGAGLFSSAHQTLAFAAICLFAVVRYLTCAEPVTFSTLGRTIPVILVVCIFSGISLLPKSYRDLALVWALPPVGLCFLAWYVVQEVGRYRRAPQFRSPK
jgi:hypothetical protein